MAFVVVVSLLTLVSVVPAHAQVVDGPKGCRSGEGCDQGMAYSLCMQAASLGLSELKRRQPNSRWTGTACNAASGSAGYGAFEAFATDGGSLGNLSSTVSPNKYYWLATKTCSARQDTTGTGPWSSVTGSARNGSIQCNSGCETMWNKNSDGTMTGTTAASGFTCTNNKDMCSKFPGYYWNAYLQACEPTERECDAGKVKDASGDCVEEQCPAGMVLSASGTCITKNHECPAGNVKAPSGECLPGEGQCAQGEAKGKDGTCKRDSNGDGTPDSEEGEDDPDKDSASGGENCSTPPSCNGNPIMCLQLRTQWRIDCNTRKDRNINGGACGAVPVCVGKDCDAMEYAQLLQQWKASCALEKLANKTGDTGGGDEGQPEWTKVGGMNQDPGAGATADDAPKLNVIKMSTDSLDQSGFGGGACIGFAAGGGSGISSGFMQTLASPPPLWCNFIGMVKAVFILVGACASVFILAKGAG